MRKLFGQLLAESMSSNGRLFLLAGDVGYGVLDAAWKAAPERCYNMGASEQAMIGAAVGLTYEGFVPICYTITPFLLYRPYEWLRNYVQHERAPVRLVGSGQGKDYGTAGHTHWADDQWDVLSALPALEIYAPWSEDELRASWPHFLERGPAYLNLRR